MSVQDPGGPVAVQIGSDLLQRPEVIVVDGSGNPLSVQGTQVAVTPVLDTSAYTAGDVLFETTAFPLVTRSNDSLAWLREVLVADNGDVGAAIDLYFFSANVALGVRNAAPTISDANLAGYCLGYVSILGVDYKDLGGAKIAQVSVNLKTLKPASGTRTVYVAAVSPNGATYAAADDLQITLNPDW